MRISHRGKPYWLSFLVNPNLLEQVSIAGRDKEKIVCNLDFLNIFPEGDALKMAVRDAMVYEIVTQKVTWRLLHHQ